MKRIILFSLLGIVFLVLGIGQWYKFCGDKAFYDGYDAALPLNAAVRADTGEEGYRMVDVVYDSLPGVQVPTLLALPADAAGPYPCIIFLHGIGQEKEFLHDIAARFTRAGFAIACFDQHTRGERDLPDASVIEEALGLRRRAALNVIDTRRLVDYLETRADIAPDRIYLLGASFGAITGAPAAAMEPRLKAAVLTYGGGDLPTLLNSRAAREEMGAFSGLVAAFGSWLLAPADPVLHVGGIAPRPILMQNGTDDALIPYEAAEALFEAAEEPKEFVAYESDHIGLDPDHVVRVLDDTIVWLKAQDAAITGADEAA